MSLGSSRNLTPFANGIEFRDDSYISTGRPAEGENSVLSIQIRPPYQAGSLGGANGRYILLSSSYEYHRDMSKERALDVNLLETLR
jgi:hypothetical protein